MGNQFLLSLITGIFVAGAASYIGSLMITRRMALAGDALGHVALPGMGIALLLGFDVSLGAFLFLFLGILLIWFFGLRTSLSMEALVGVVFVASLALGFLIVPEPELLHALIGDISQMSFGGMLTAVVFSALIFFVLRLIYPKIILINISEDLAKTEKISVKKYNLAYLLLIAVVVALGVKITGSLLVGALVIAPAAAARNFSRNLSQYSFWSVVFGGLSAVSGILLFKFFGLPAGPMIVLTSALIFIISVVPKKRE